jgi:small subunit ribosomal protein S6
MKYEFMGIVKPFLPEDVRLQLIKGIKKKISSSGGKVEKEDLWGKRHLAYKIKGHEEGYYVLYFIELPSEKVVKLEEELRMTNDLLRYILIKRD